MIKNIKCKQCRQTGGFHKMDCSENFNRNQTETVATPTIITIKDEKHHRISHTIVDYNKIEEILSTIQHLEERNSWHHEISVPPSIKFFLSELARKDCGK